MGDYTLKLYIRHEKIEEVEKLKNLVVYLRQRVFILLFTDHIFKSYASLLEDEETESSVTVVKGQSCSIFLKCIPGDNLPINVSKGDFLSGKLQLYNDSKIRNIVILFEAFSEIFNPHKNIFKLGLSRYFLSYYS